MENKLELTVECGRWMIVRDGDVETLSVGPTNHGHGHKEFLAELSQLVSGVGINSFGNYYWVLHNKAGKIYCESRIDYTTPEAAFNAGRLIVRKLPELA